METIACGHRLFRPRWNRFFFATLLFLLLSGRIASAVTFTDDFNDGVDDGWTRYAPFGGTPYAFPSGGYQITAPTSGNAANPGRTGTFRADQTYTQFYAAVDIVNWNDNLDQAFGVVARAKEIGPGSSDGYVFTYANLGPSIDISSFTNEVPTTIGTTDLPAKLDVNKDYRLVFSGNGTSLKGELYDLANLATPLFTVTSTNGTYTSGINGLLVFDNSNAVNGADATFDNFVADVVPEPTSLAAVALMALLGCKRRRRSAACL